MQQTILRMAGNIAAGICYGLQCADVENSKVDIANAALEVTYKIINKLDMNKLIK